ncbi:hypothetical protein FRB91_010051 [Serendipita sp. 411]|nr:hypothetical protein FRC16_001400 [Serendipita sp. 398]KAG8825775.1 hypothetical protein FRC19_010539 [Serendipita sp. 401]KAG8858299.1 hypothetical protein FRB91_010051 [Serendipita sp. 411]KAG9056080.1 hypothetical protein FS842_000370 [Serendipita sp. 407]
MLDFGEEVRENLPDIDETVLEYIDGYVNDEDSLDEDIPAVVRELLGSFARSKEAVLEELLKKLEAFLEEKYKDKSRNNAPKLTRLDRVMDMSKSGMSNTIALSEGVDLESINKSKASRVDLKKLEKQELKIRAKIEKRSKRQPLYEGSKLIEAQKKQQSYEEMFMKVNSLDASLASKGKSKDIHLPAIDVSFGSNRILSGASLTLAHGRRYGLIGRNGVGKSTLLRHISMRDVPIPAHITILFVEQEIVGDDTTALDSVLKADVWRDYLLKQEMDFNKKLAELESGDDKATEEAREELSARLGEVHTKLAEMDAESGPARAATLLSGLGFSEADQQMPTKSFSGGWRMRLALARALFVKPALLLLDEPSNHIDLNALAWLEDYLQTWENTILVVSHDRAFLDAVATDIIHQHSCRLDYYRGNFTQFYATKSERERNQRREYEAQMLYRQGLQQFIDRWRYNANRAAQAQARIKILEKLPELEPPETEDTESFKFPDVDKISPPLLQLSGVDFSYSSGKQVLKNIYIDIGLESRIAVVGANGAGKSTLIKLLTGELEPQAGQLNRNGRLRIGYFAQHHVDQLDPTVSSVAFLASKFPGKTELEYRSHLGAFGITGLTGLQLIGTLSGGQKSRVAFAALSLQRPHILLLDEPSNHLDIQGIDALMLALQNFTGGVIVISHDERFLTTVSKELWVCAEGSVQKYGGDVQAYKNLIVNELKKSRP